MRRILVGIAIVALAVPLSAPLAAQGTVYEFGPESRYDTGCLEPSPCDCAPQVVGPMIGGFRLVPLLPQVGGVYEYAIVDFVAFINPLISDPVPIHGSGVYTVDSDAGTQEVFLGVVVGGAPKTFITSFGPVPLAPGFPAIIEVDIFEPVVECVIDGMRIRAAQPEKFIRGDANEDGSLDLGDPIRILGDLFGPIDPIIPCPDSYDANDDGSANIADAVTLLTYLFNGTAPPAAPFPTCGQDPTFDLLDCTVHGSCGVPGVPTVP
jgi:hypothetical protein